MGYSYDGSMRLCCDDCGDASNEAPGVRKRTCTQRVKYADGTAVPYCPPPALCDACYRNHGGAKIHERCKAGAARRTAEEAVRAARLALGELESSTGWGEWAPGVPPGFVGRRFVGKDDAELYLLIPRAVDDAVPLLRSFLPDYQRAAESLGVSLLLWSDPARPSGSKEVTVLPELPPMLGAPRLTTTTSGPALPSPAPSCVSQLHLFHEEA